MALVTMPDGATVDMPDNPSPEQLKALAKLREGGPSFLGEAGKVLDQSFRGGVLALPGMVGDAVYHAGNWLEKHLPITPESMKAPMQEPSAALAQITGGPVSKPQSAVGKVLGNIGEATVATVTGGPISKLSLGKNAAIGALGGAGAEVAGRLTGDNPIARFAGGMAGGLAGGLLTTPVTNREEIARAALRDVDPMDLKLAQAEMAARQAEGRPINLSQAMAKPSNIDKLVDVLANAKEGEQVTNMLRTQPAQALQATEAFTRNLPGNILPKSNMANQMQEGATEVVNQAKRARTKTWENTLANSQSALGPEGLIVSEAAVDQIAKKLTGIAGKFPNTSKGAFLTDLRDKLYKDGFAINDPTQLNEILKEASAKLKPVNLQTTGLDAGTAKWLGNQVNGLREEFGQAFSPIRDANAAYRAATPAIDELKKSVVGRLAQPAGSIADKEATLGKLTAVLDAGSTPGAKVSDISTLARTLSSSGQGDIFQNGVKSWMADKVGGQVREAGGRGNEDIAAAIHKSFFETEKQKQGFLDAMAGVAQSQGLDKKPFVDGATRFFDYLGRLSRRPGSVSGMSGEDFRRTAESSIFGKLGQVSVITPLRQPVLKYVDWLRSDAYSAMDKLLTSPEGVDMLMKLGKQPTMSPAVQKAISTFIATGVGAGQSPDINAE